MTLARKDFPLSLVKVSGKPNTVIICSHRPSATCSAVASGTAFAQGQPERRSTNVSIHLLCRSVIGKGPTKSMWILLNTWPGFRI